MNQIPNIEETYNTRDVEELKKEFIAEYKAGHKEGGMRSYLSTGQNGSLIADWWIEKLHQQLQKAREEALAREKQLKQVHMMELDAISCMSLEQYVVWRDQRKQRPKHSELDQDKK